MDFIFSNESVDEYFVKCDSECLFHLISQKDFLQIIDQKNLWKDVSRILSTQVSCLLYRDAVLSGSNVYEVVRHAIQYLWALNEEYRRKISIYDFISKRFKSASRSSVHKIVKGLNDGGYVKTERGVIIDVKRLPNNF
ncbi:MAG: helix-turn-helix domain-containing protein [Aeromonas veronii]